MKDVELSGPFDDASVSRCLMHFRACVSGIDASERRVLEKERIGGLTH